MTPYRAAQIAQEKGFPLSYSTAHRLAKDKWSSLDRGTLEAMCLVLGVEPSELLGLRRARRPRAVPA